MLTDEQLGERLRTQLHDEVADVHAAPELNTTLRRRRARQVNAVRMALVVPVVTAAVAGTLVAAGGHGGRHAPPAAGAQSSSAAFPSRAGGGGAPRNTGAPAMLDVAYVRKETAKALSAADQYIRYEDGRYPGSGTGDVSWADPATHRYHRDTYIKGTLRIADLVTIEGRAHRQLVVDYKERTWWVGGYTMPKNPGLDIDEPDQLKAAITEGTMRVVGRERMDGHDAIHLRVTDLSKLPDNYRAPDNDSVVDIWVDEHTFLPCRVTERFWFKSDPQHKKTNMGPLDHKFEWLPRTPENLADLTLKIPAGFKKFEWPTK